ncbi:MAG TPA: ACT domain-containing protein, partial [Candidatus Xenobia bacterium]
MQRVVLTAVGRDRPGIVAGVARVLYDTGCNIEDSSMTILGGEFVMILVVNLQKEEDAEQFHARLRDVETRFGLAVSLKPLEPWAEQKMDRQSFDVYTISVYGSDKPGIVYQITDELARQNVNVTDVDTKRVGPASRSV